MSAREQIEQQATIFLLRREEADWSAEDAHELDEWLAASMAHKAAFWRIEHGWQRADRLAAVGTSPLPEKGPRMPPRLMALAAAMLLSIGLAASFLLRDAAPLPVETVRSGGEGRSVRLADGTYAQLNVDTVLRTRVGPKTREIWLDKGEVFLEVAHDHLHPFVVHGGSRDVTVLGTRFNVERRGGDETVSVLNGSVRLNGTGAATGISPIVLTRGEIAAASGLSTLVRANALQVIENRLAWRQGKLIFDDEPLGRVVVEFNRYGGRKLRIADPATAALRIGGSFDTKGAEAFARLLENAYDLDVRRNADEIVISGK